MLAIDVLILVLLELTLLQSQGCMFFNKLTSFNPCFIGTYSITSSVAKNTSYIATSFNPCFIGTYSITCTPLSCPTVSNILF